MTELRTGEVSVNGRSYRKPATPTVVICYDGCDPRYISHGVLNGLLPNISRIISDGFFAVADAAMPTFTNPNNMSIVTGAPPKVHGISGNYYLDKATGREVMITDASRVSSGCSGGACRCRRAGGRDHSQGQAPQDGGPRPEGHLLFLRARA
jgi:phosphonoacetate hydrolase